MSVANPLPSTATAVFQESAEQLALRLEQDSTPPARMLAEEARDLVKRFKAWQRERPSNEERVSTIQQLFDLNRRVMDHFSA